MDWFDGILGGGGGNISQLMPLLYAAQAAGQASQPSRMPVSTGSVLGNIAGGVGEGYMQGQKGNYLQAQANKDNLANLGAAQQWNLWAPFMGTKPISMSEISGGLLGGDQPQGGTLGGTLTAPASPPPSGDAVSQLGPSGAGGGPTPQLASATTPQQPSPLGGGQPAQQPMLGGGASPAPQAGGGLDMQALYSLPPPVLQKMGITVPPELTALAAAGVKPGSPEWKNATMNLAIKGMGIDPFKGGDRAGVPFTRYDLASNTHQLEPDALKIMGAAAQTQAAASGAGALPSKESEAAFKAGLDVKVSNETEKRKAFYTTGVMPAEYGSAAANAPQAAPNGAIATPAGTVVPPPPKRPPFQGTDALTKQNTNTQETEKNFGAIRPGLDGAESRMVALADALKVVEGAGFNEHRADLANKLRGLGMSTLADTVMSGKETAAVQKAIGVQVIDVLQTLKTAIGPGQRLLNSEFTNTLNKQYGADLSPSANYDLLTQALGGVYQTRGMIDDYYKYGKPMGWPDANAYVSAYQSTPENSYKTMVERAGQAIGPLKGMPGGPGDAPAKTTAAPAIAEGRTATNPKTGERLVFKGGQWTPLK